MVGWRRCPTRRPNRLSKAKQGEVAKESFLTDDSDRSQVQRTRETTSAEKLQFKLATKPFVALATSDLVGSAPNRIVEFIMSRGYIDLFIFISYTYYFFADPLLAHLDYRD